MPTKNFDIAQKITIETCPKRRLQVDSIRLFAGIIERKAYNKGDIILAEGSVCHAMMYIEKGLVRQYYFKHDKEMTEPISCEQGVVICIDSYFNQRPTQLIVEALEDTVIWEIPYAAMEKLASEVHDISYLYRHFLQNSLILSQVKADMLRFESAKDRYTKLMQHSPEIVRRAPLTYIASYLQMTLETLSRARASIVASEQ